MSEDDQPDPTIIGTGQRPSDQPAKIPARVGRYRVLSILGKGGFGRGYLAIDEKLNRKVAVKIPHAELVATENAAKEYLAEAQTLASLDHPAVVPVYDVGSSDEFPFYIVSKYIDGTDLLSVLRTNKLPWASVVPIFRSISEALHHAHGRGFVHRDVKPGNILIDEKGVACLVDFGLAIRDDEPIKPVQCEQFGDLETGDVPL